MDDKKVLELLDRLKTATAEIDGIVDRLADPAEKAVDYMAGNGNLAVDEMEEIAEELGNIKIATDEINRRLDFIRKHIGENLSAGR